jgi:predicted RNA-binding protein
VCLAKAYLNRRENEPVVQDIAHMRLNSEQIELKTFLGEEQIIPGRVVEIDFSISKILIDNRIDTYKSS